MAFSEPIARRPRILLVLLGLALVPASAAVGYWALLVLDGVDAGKVPGAAGRLVLAYELGVLALPLLLLATGLAALLATNDARLTLVVVLAGALAVDLVLAALLYQALWSPSCRSHPLPPNPKPVSTVIDATGCVPTR